MIVRAPAPTKNSLHIEPVPPEPRAPSRQPSAQPQSLSQPQSSRPAAKKLRADGSSRAVGKAKEREVYATNRAEPEVDEDVRQMQSETDSLRRRSQAAGQGVNSADVEFPPRTPRPPNSGSRRNVDTTEPIAARETPQIEKYKMMRGETGHRRRSSVSRGKRVSSSYEATGVICEWHVPLLLSVRPPIRMHGPQPTRIHLCPSRVSSSTSTTNFPSPSEHGSCSFGVPTGL